MEWETENYTLDCDRFGNYVLTRKSDRASAYFQGDDAWAWDREIAALCRAKHCMRDELFDAIASEYDEVLEVEG